MTDAQREAEEIKMSEWIDSGHKPTDYVARATIKRLESEVGRLMKYLNLFLSIGPDYKPMIKRGWVRTFTARKARVKKALTRQDKKEGE